MRTSREILAAGALIVVTVVASDALAAQSPFGVGTPDGPGVSYCGPLRSVCVWLATHQAEFYDGLRAALKATRDSATAAWLLIGLSFAYGVFHAAGPGHGKVVITSYLLASGEKVRRGIGISFVSAFVQAATAILVVAILAALLNVTASTMTNATAWLEIGSYALIAVVGAWLLWSKIFGGHHHHHHHFVPAGPEHGHHANDHCHERHRHDEHGHDHHHHEEPHHGHAVSHARAQAPGSILARPWSAILAVGIRPCSGAIIILVFALAQGLFMTGVAATFAMALGTGLTVAALATLAASARGVAIRLAGSEGSAVMRVARGIEIAGAATVMILGLLLLGGALSGALPS
jgi:nickel/cobalt exporter